ncbi:MAG: riboflavin synthase [Planctomycetota bacterium]|nr:MAG: riboflavin synthase [Planctomycetota bacterium]
MFTGIIETIGIVRQARPSGNQMRLAIDLNRIADGTNLGDSIAVNGVCLTVCQLNGTVAEFDVSTETVRKTTLISLKTSSPVNLERAMSAQGRFGGHIVQGHIDGLGKIAAVRKQADFAQFRFEVPKELIAQIVLKGSVAVDGVSVTVAKMDAAGFEVAVIPTTLKETTWHQAKVGDAVNIETDILVKITQRQLAAMLPASKGLTIEQLREHGF